ncbi:reverse transcriptase domain, Reverse transcriptase zinc-binding domain protein [Artemisia annua]|uniref:Reverse transcriptase domain, Reverse transcriptase zinc-binding domain protein n=1 Tax=Artemisia annua TaxID=35608 RepID=A0A2U1KZC0_ARTAN|nr:reverse transcriptase domain, Reverse transcriptase zinc-binding domain protein [Artemisia annua]
MVLLRTPMFLSHVRLQLNPNRDSVTNVMNPSNVSKTIGPAEVIESQSVKYASVPTSFGELNVGSTMNTSRHNDVDVEEAVWLSGITSATNMVNPSEFPSLYEVTGTANTFGSKQSFNRTGVTGKSNNSTSLGSNVVYGGIGVTGNSTSFGSTTTSGMTKVTGLLNIPPPNVKNATNDANMPEGDGVSVSKSADRFKLVSPNVTNTPTTSPNSPPKGKSNVNNLEDVVLAATQDTPIVHSSDVNQQPKTYVGVTSGTQPAPTKGVKTPSNSIPTHGETSTKPGQPSATVGASNSNVNSIPNEGSQPTRNVTTSSSHPEPKVSKPKPKPFKFSNFLIHKEGFSETVASGWNLSVNGSAMYCVVKWLKGLKSPFRKLLHNHGNLHERVDRLRKELDELIEKRAGLLAQHDTCPKTINKARSIRRPYNTTNGWEKHMLWTRNHERSNVARLIIQQRTKLDLERPWERF